MDLDSLRKIPPNGILMPRPMQNLYSKFSQSIKSKSSEIFLFFFKLQALFLRLAGGNLLKL